MTQFSLTRRQRRLLEALVAHTPDATVLRRAQALLWVAAGDSVTHVAHRLCVTRQAIYKWIRLFQHSSISNLATRLQAAPRSGRPVTVKGVIEPLLDEVIDHDPRLFGLNSTQDGPVISAVSTHSACPVRFGVQCPPSAGSIRY